MKALHPGSAGAFITVSAEKSPEGKEDGRDKDGDGMKIKATMP